MKIRPVALLLITATILSSYILVSTAEAIDPEKQPIYANANPANNTMCGTDSTAGSPVPCTVPVGRRLIIEHVSGYALLPTSTNTTLAVSLLVTDLALGLPGGTFHTFVATKTSSSGVTDVFTFSTPFKMMLNPGASFYFSITDSVAVSGYLVKQ